MDDWGRQKCAVHLDHPESPTATAVAAAALDIDCNILVLEEE